MNNIENETTQNSSNETLELLDVLRDATRSMLQNVNTALVAKVIKKNTKTLDVQPVVNLVVGGEDVPYPVFSDVPVLWSHGGTSQLTFPIAVGDYVLLVFSQRCFDNWYDGKDFKPPLEPRLHDLSDAVAIPGLFNKAGAPDIPAETTLTGIMRLGTLNPGDFVALAAKVKSEIQALRNTVNTNVTIFNAHTHAVSGGTAAATATAQSAPAAVGDVKSAYVKAD